MVPDTPNDNKKCGLPGSANRVFYFRGSNAQEQKCRDECTRRKNCVAFSGIWNSFCIGCSVALDATHSGAKAFRKENEGKNSLSL